MTRKSNPAFREISRPHSAIGCRPPAPQTILPHRAGQAWSKLTVGAGQFSSAYRSSSKIHNIRMDQFNGGGSRLIHLDRQKQKGVSILSCLPATTIPLSGRTSVCPSGSKSPRTTCSPKLHAGSPG